MAFPASWTRVQVNGRYIMASGLPAQGQVEFSIYPDQRIVSAIDDSIVVPETIIAELDENGEFSVLVPASNDPDITPHFAWRVHEAFSNNRRFNYYIEVPHDLVSLDISHALEVEQGPDLAVYLRRSGDRLTGYLTLHADPVDPMHPATKGYVDLLIDDVTSQIPSVDDISHQTKVFEFPTPAGHWLINHNLGRYPQVSILDSDDEVVDSDITHNSENQLVISFSDPLQGKAVLT